MPIKRVAGAFFDSIVVVTMMTTLGLIVGVLALAIAFSGPAPISLKIIVLCFAIGLIGVIAMILQMHAIIKQRRLRNDLTVLYLEGRELTNQLAANYTPERNAQVEGWKQRVVEFLRKDMEISHVARFETADLRVLVEFIKELGG